MVRHTSVLELVRGVMSVVDLDTEDRVALFLPFTFDGSVLQFWLSPAAGATAVVVPLPVAQSMPDFLDLLRREAVTLVIQVPTTLRALAYAHEEAGRPPLALRYILVGGESVELDVVSAFLARCPGTAPCAHRSVRRCRTYSSRCATRPWSRSRTARSARSANW